jgi:glucose uptake protein
MVAALWGVFIWKEFKGANKSVNILLSFMFLFFIAGLALIIVSGN